MGIYPKTIIYIDNANLYYASVRLGFDIDYKKFFQWLKQKYKAATIFMFIGFKESNIARYKYFQACGFNLVFKQTVSHQNITKGNCDSEMVLQVMSDFYTREYDKCILITGDGDFACLVRFLKRKSPQYGRIRKRVFNIGTS